MPAYLQILTYIRITSDFLAQTLEARKAWSKVIQALRRVIANQEFNIQQSCPSILMEK
jgi:hypothetical protein